MVGNAEHQRVGDLPSLTQLIPDGAARDRAAEAIAAIVRGVDPAQLPALDDQVRRGSGWADPWATLEPSSLERMAHRCAHPVGVVLAAGMCRNGYVRQRALELMDRRATAAPDSRLRLLLLRANDWVPQVRAAALSRLEHIDERTPGPVLVRALPLIQRLYRVGRLRDTQVVDRLIDTVVNRHWDDLLAGLRAGPLSVRRSSAQLSLMASGGRQRAAVDRILSSVADPVSRRHAARTIIASNPSRDALANLARDRAVAVRMVALAELADRSDLDAQLVTDALTDPARRVRDVAQFHARRLGLDAAEHYRACLAANPACISGLGEVGRPGDADRIVDLARHPRARVRSAAVGAIGRLAGKEHMALLYRVLDDPSARVSRAARVALESSGVALAPDQLGDLIAHGAHPSARRNAVLLVTRVDRWPQLWLSLEALPTLPDSLAPLVIARIERWYADYGRRWTSIPSRHDLDHARAALHLASAAVPAPLRAGLAHLFDRLHDARVRDPR